MRADRGKFPRRNRLISGASDAVVVMLDDLHWGSGTLLETLEELVETMAPVPLLLVCLGRTELRERMAGTLAAERTTVLGLSGLTDEEAARLVAGLRDEQGRLYNRRPPHSSAR